MIQYVEGDILLTEAEGLVHGVAPSDDFKQGLALSLRKNWPSLYKDFRHYCKTTHPKEGELWSWRGTHGPTIISMLTQKEAAGKNTHPGKATLANVNHCLRSLVKDVKDNNYKSLAITKVATGVGGLEWSDVKPLIEKALEGLNVPVYVYETYRQGVKAKEITG